MKGLIKEILEEFKFSSNDELFLKNIWRRYNEFSKGGSRGDAQTKFIEKYGSVLGRQYDLVYLFHYIPLYMKNTKEGPLYIHFIVQKNVGTNADTGYVKVIYYLLASTQPELNDLKSDLMLALNGRNNTLAVIIKKEHYPATENDAPKFKHSQTIQKLIKTIQIQ